MNDKLLHTIIKAVKGVLIVLGFVFGILLMLKGNDAVLGPGRLLDSEKSLSENITLWEAASTTASENDKLVIQDNINAIKANQSFAGILSFSMNLMKYLIIGGLLLAIGFAIYLTITDIKGNLVFLIGLAVFIVIVLLCWSMASDAMLESWKLRDPELFNPAFVKFSDFSIKLIMAFGSIAITLIFFGWVWGLVKRYSA